MKFFVAMYSKISTISHKFNNVMIWHFFEWCVILALLAKSHCILGHQMTVSLRKEEKENIVFF